MDACFSRLDQLLGPTSLQTLRLWQLLLWYTNMNKTIVWYLCLVDFLGLHFLLDLLSPWTQGCSVKHKHKFTENAWHLSNIFLSILKKTLPFINWLLVAKSFPLKNNMHCWLNSVVLWQKWLITEMIWSLIINFLGPGCRKIRVGKQERDCLCLPDPPPLYWPVVVHWWTIIGQQLVNKRVISLILWAGKGLGLLFAPMCLAAVYNPQPSF